MSTLFDMFEHAESGLAPRLDLVVPKFGWNADVEPARSARTGDGCGTTRGEPAAGPDGRHGPAGANGSAQAPGAGRSPGLSGRTLSTLGWMLAGLRRTLAMRDDYRRLMAMSTRELSDIGVSRGHVEGTLRHGRGAACD